MGFLIKLVLGLVILLVALLIFHSWQVDHSANQKAFEMASAPSPALNGFYTGAVNLPVKVTWAGKKFNSASSTGINVFDDGSEGYPFKTSVGTVGSSTVLNIAYDLPENPAWVRAITDQLVQTGPDHYLGKITATVIPGYTLSLGFFRLSK